ncbi:TetR family transcriptional regulator [Krasilnikovia sp. MM14-A1004]|uniref:TetR family transcriptional regulator n=1 Tax=Krasilnikovia sp. MM14-A1004 TaxID=3373541 RepID=UPI00399CCC48
MTQATGLRERKKAATRLALHEAALRLAAEDGFDHLTVEAIADAANVSRRTFFNYFSGKEEAIAYGDAVRLARLVQLVREQPADDPPWTALSRVADQLIAEGYADPDPAWLAQRRRLRAHPALAAQQIAAYATVERELAAELAARLPGPDAELRSRVLAATYLTTLRVAIQYWTDHPDSSIRDMVHTALATAAPAPDR